MRTPIRTKRRVNKSKPATDNETWRLGNQNAALPHGADKSAFIAIRCTSRDKGAWASAAKLAKEAGEIVMGPRDKSLLILWVIKTLNDAADAENKPEITSMRRAAEAKRKDAAAPENGAG